jgi:polyisoprenyl-phosphate glycosyltransferase
MKTLSTQEGFTVILPAYNEGNAIRETLSKLKDAMTSLQTPHEVLVVNDGSHDNTQEEAQGTAVTVIRHPINSGYGRSLLTGIEAARYDTIVIVDADGTYPLEDLPKLLAYYDRGFHMVVGARQGHHYFSSISKSLLRSIFRLLAEFTCGRSIPDINSGFRIFDRRPVLRWRDSLSTGFSFTTTITLLFMLNNLFVGYLPISYSKRIGKSKVRLIRDGLRSLQIIITTIAQFNPMKLYILLAGANIFGNVILALLAYYCGAHISFFNLFLGALGWNFCTLIAGASILALALTKPAGAYARPPAPNDKP